jgi:2-keto-4-pentenoate hydratase/2-oxohepta-3-ene-1,7-dioic acid hydratase in catechol pathway
MSHVSIEGSGEEVRVSKIICIGANYDSHNREMGRRQRVEAILFLKPLTALLHDGGTFEIPAFSTEVQHELELVLMIGTGGKRIPADKAKEHIRAVAAGLDMTARDMQRVAKERGLPWAMAKGFDGSAPITSFVPVSGDLDPDRLNLTLSVNGEVRQRADTSGMILNCASIISYASRFFSLEPGDLIFTGTPEGVAPVKDGDRMEIAIDGRTSAAFDVKEELDVEKC